MHSRSHHSLKIISVGTETETFWLRDAVLQSAGFQVFSAIDPELALAKIKEGDGDVLLLYYRLPSRVPERLASAFREIRPTGKIIVVSNKVMEKPDFADALLYKLEGPEALINVISKRSDT